MLGGRLVGARCGLPAHRRRQVTDAHLPRAPAPFPQIPHVQVDWASQPVVYFNYADFAAACPFRDLDGALL